MSDQYRIETDLLGSREIPEDAYYGIHTLRAVENFPISETTISAYPALVNALADVKQASARANMELGWLEETQGQAIVSACQELRAGRWHDQFVVDVIQGGAGTSTNMNANEVIANRALELLGKARGDYAFLHPNEHVNLGQSTNDVVPTALKIATWVELHELIRSLEVLRAAFQEKGFEFDDILKVGRTQLQDAVPMTLGQELHAYASMLVRDEEELRHVSRLLCEINLGGTAIGTGITAHPEFAQSARKHLSTLTGMPLVTAPDLIEATQDASTFVQISGALKRVAVKVSKVCNDLRLLSSGPRAGFFEISLPPVQAGSSLMPGKVNPVIPEVVNQIAFEVIGNDVTVSLAAEAGQLQLNAFLPIIGYSMLKSIHHLTRGCRVLAERCVSGMVANRERIREQLDQSLCMVTALNPRIGYVAATEIAHIALRTGRRVFDIVLEQGFLTADELDQLGKPEALIGTQRPTPLGSHSEAKRWPYVSTGHLPPPDQVRALVADAHQRFIDVEEGTPSQVYPALADVAPGLFGLSLVSTHGEVYAAGDWDHPFAVMSVSKPFIFALICELIGAEEARRLLGVNSTGLPFNSLAAVERTEDGRTNPMVNAGAIATTALSPGKTQQEKWRFLQEGLSRFAGRDLTMNDQVLASALATNDRNRSIARLLRTYEPRSLDVAEVVELYTKQCSLNVTSHDLAVMGATLAGGGINPLTHERVVHPEAVHHTLAVMTTAGLYETSGDWLYDVGVPGKSGIGGGIVTVSPGKAGLGTFAPPLDAAGNSVKGQRAARFLSRELGLDILVSDHDAQQASQNEATR